MAEQETAGNSTTERMQAEVAELQRLNSEPFATSALGYIKRTGPGLLQSAMTLGAGSAAASVIAGASFGYKLLWVQPVAMFLGVMMLGALSNVVLTTGERPYKSFGREIGKWLVVLWALGTIMSSIIWHFPQYGLAASAARDLGDLQGIVSTPPEIGSANALIEEAQKTKDAVQIAAANEALASARSETPMGLGFTQAGLMVSFGIGLLILCINIVTTFNYGGDSRGVRVYEWFLRGCIALVVVMFGMVVVAKIDVVAGDIGEIFKGFIGWYGIPNLWNPDGTMNNSTVTQVLGMLGAAVGINMTFLYPYSLLKKGWGKDHKKLARWDLGMTMFLPFVLVTSLVIIAMKVGGVYDGADVVNTTIKPLGAAKALSGVLGENAGRVIFDLGLIGMTCGAISTHMVVCGFTFCEMFGLEQTKSRFRMFALVPAIGILGVISSLPIWFPVAASAVCFTMLPIAYFAFLIMNNKRSYIGDAVGSGWTRVVFNLVLVIALAVATIGSGIKIYGNVIQKLFPAKAPAAAVIQGDALSSVQPIEMKE
ncbi:divalent metal cation transporter [Novipirellula artificiosorum]|uniref:Manganese transport protein MntH n=1 Tax=Novipirellula artificiosorum TaxID=2528016 RepID=A0A5C6CXV4_9BACT|nr:divalent metal cation transporter [Novipirellula artificiosorum]TWU28735.1 manganese transport protein MntH [Novipirellula artificiosorum]